MKNVIRKNSKPLRLRYEILREALNRIASWDEGTDVTSYFDEPGSAQVAREALAKAEGE